MELLILILQVFGLLVIVLVVIALAARATLKGRGARQANEAARIGAEAPASDRDVNDGAGGRSGRR